MRSIEALTFVHCLMPSIHKWAGGHCLREGSLEYPGPGTSAFRMYLTIVFARTWAELRPALSESLKSAESGLPFGGVRNSARNAPIIAHGVFALVQALVEMSGGESSAVDIKTGP
jgi:hypothetical protein